MARDEASSSADEIPAINENIVSGLIHQKLDEIRSGDLFILHDLKDDAVDDLLHDANQYKTFEAIIGKTWMEIDMLSNEERGLNGGKLNRKKKIYTKALRMSSDFVRMQIQAYIKMRRAQGNSKGEIQEEEQDEQEVFESEDSADDSEEEDTVSSLSDGKISRSSSQKRKKKKKKLKKKKLKEKRKKKRKKRQSHESSEVDDDDGESLSSLNDREENRLRRRLGKAKVLFEKGRDDIMARIPDDVKTGFLKLGFAKWGKEWLPVVQLSPFQVPPGSVRDQWMEMFNNTLRNKRPMSRLMFWYGTPKDDLSVGYSFVPHNKFMSYEQGRKANHHGVPQKIEKKLDSSKKLTASEAQRVEGLDQINSDINLEPSERTTWLFDFEEDYDHYLDQIDDESSVDDEIIETSSSKDKKKRRKKKDQKGKDKKVPKTEKDLDSKKQKRKRKTETEEVEPSKKAKKSKPSDEDVQPPGKKKKSKKNHEDAKDDDVELPPMKKTKKIKKPKPVDKDAEQPSKNLKAPKSLDEEVKLPRKKPKKSTLREEVIESPAKKESKAGPRDEEIKATTKKENKSRSLDEEIAMEVAEEDAVMQMDASSEDEEDDDFCDRDSDSEDDDEEFYEENHDRKPVKNKSKSIVAPAKSATSIKLKTKKEILKSPEEIEQELFENCEKLFLPLMEKLQAVDEEGGAEKLLKKIDRDVHKLTPAFIRTHKIGLIVKAVRSQFKDSIVLNQMCKKITSKMKSTFSAKLESEPKGFEPKIKKVKKKKSTTKIPESVKEEVRNEPQTKSPLSVPAEEAPSIQSQVYSKPTPIVSLAISIKAASFKKDEGGSTSEPPVPPKKIPRAMKLKAKAPRKSFSLAGMIENKRNPTPPIANANDEDSEMDTSRQSLAKLDRPEWTVNYQHTGHSFETNPNRIFGIEFLMDAVSCLPKGKVDPPSVARGIEDALNTKYDGDYDKYMERVHDICAAISGKKQMGSLAQKIVAGNYATPVDVINIPRKTLFQSFEGSWIP